MNESGESTVDSACASPNEGIELRPQRREVTPNLSHATRVAASPLRDVLELIRGPLLGIRPDGVGPRVAHRDLP